MASKLSQFIQALVPIAANPIKYYDSTSQYLKFGNCKELLLTTIPFIDSIIDSNKMDLIYMLTAWVYAVLHIPYVSIDGIDFIPLSYAGDIDSRIKLQLVSIPKERQNLHVFYMYTSKSSGSTWRYCEYDDEYGHINKGFDYVSNTFIHIKLQMFLDSHLYKIPKKISFYQLFYLILNENQKNKLRDVLIHDCRDTDLTEKNKSARNNIYEIDRIVPDDVFRPMRKLLSPARTFKTSISKQYLLIIDNLKELKKNAMNTFLPRSPQNTRYTNRMNEIAINIITEKSFSDKVISAVKSRSGALNKTDYLLYLDILHKYVDIYNAYLNYYFRVESSKENHIVYSYENIKPPINLEGWNIVFGQIQYKVLIKKDSEKKFKVIYQTYSITSSPNNVFNGDYKINLAFVPHNISINKYGLYDQFISSGFYVYKMFDYDSQVGSLMDDTNRNAGGYIFIGDIMNRFMPLS